MSIGVVIPYFQEAPGILSRALASAFAQRDVDDVRIVIVDDSSPISAESELASFDKPRFPVTVIKQKNAGPAAARNRALDALGGDVRYVAFLDSDDMWTEAHLVNAIAALESGFDFYFTDFYQLDQDVSAFNRAGRIQVATHPRIGSSQSLHEYVGDMFTQILQGNLIGTPTVVYDRERLGHLRFDAAFFSAGEDYLFWMACVAAGARFCFSTECEVRCGLGVNIYTGSGWGTDGHLLRVHNELKYRKHIARAFSLSEPQREFVCARIAELRIAFARDVLHRTVHRKSLQWSVLSAHARLDPASFFAVMSLAMKLPFQAFARR